MTAPSYSELINGLAAAEPRGGYSERELAGALEPLDCALILSKHPLVLEFALGTVRQAGECAALIRLGDAAGIHAGQYGSLGLWFVQQLPIACAAAIYDDVTERAATIRRDRAAGFLSEVA